MKRIIAATAVAAALAAGSTQAGQTSGTFNVNITLTSACTLPAVPDRFDNRDADVARLLLDRVDDGLDALADHDCLHLDHQPSSDRRSMRTTSRQTP